MLRRISFWSATRWTTKRCRYRRVWRSIWIEAGEFGSLCRFGIGPSRGCRVTNYIVKRISVTCPTTACTFETAGLCLVALDSSDSTKSQLRSQNLIGHGWNADWLAIALFSHRNIFLLKPCKSFTYHVWHPDLILEPLRLFLLSPGPTILRL